MILIREEDRLQAEGRQKKQLILYVAVACAYVAAALLMLFLSPEGYKPLMVLTIILTVAFGWYTIFFFSVQYDLAVKRARLLGKVLSALPEREYGVFIKEVDVMTYEGVEMRTLRFRVLDSERDIHLLQGELSLKEGEKYEIEIHSSVLVEIGEYNEKEVS